MAITKQYLKSKPICKVTFTVPAETAGTVAVVGDFNDWNHDDLPLKKLKTGVFKGTANIPVGQQYEFRYLVDGDYQNDTDADGYRWNAFAGSENSLLEV